MIPSVGTDSAVEAVTADDVAALLARLAMTDGAGLGDAARIDLLSGLERMKNAACAAQARVTVAFADSQLATQTDAESTVREVAQVRQSIGTQVALARGESPSRGDRCVGLGRALVTELPGALAEMTDGRLSEWKAVILARETACLSSADRREVDARLAETPGGMAALGPKALGAAARRISAELDAESVVARFARAKSQRRVGVRPAPDGMAWLSVFGPMHEVIGAHLALMAHAQSVMAGGSGTIAGQREDPQGRTRDQVAADAALRVLAGRSPGLPTPVEVELVLPHSVLIGSDEPGHLPGWGPIPARTAREWIASAAESEVATLRRLFSSPDGRDLVALESRTRCFTGGLAKFLRLRDQECATPGCEAGIAHGDHADTHAAGGATDALNGVGRSARCNHTKQAPGWREWTSGGTPESGPHRLHVMTPTGHTYCSTAPPLLGWGWTAAGQRPAESPAFEDPPWWDDPVAAEQRLAEFDLGLAA